MGVEPEGAVVAKPKTYSGSCHCGSVKYQAIDVSDIWYCHCRQCQHLTGHFVSAAGVKRQNLKIFGAVNWLPISQASQSGHCKSCGSYLLWDSKGFDTISLLAGSLDETSGLNVKGHIFVSEKADYYSITDGLPQYDGYPPTGTR